MKADVAVKFGPSPVKFHVSLGPLFHFGDAAQIVPSTDDPVHAGTGLSQSSLQAAQCSDSLSINTAVAWVRCDSSTVNPPDTVVANGDCMWSEPLDANAVTADSPGFQC